MELYFDWLCSLACPERGGSGNAYIESFHFLFNFAFHGWLDYDQNREAEGLYLRDEYKETTGLDSEMNGECTMLEMVIALARDMSFVTDQLVRDSSVERWVKEMVRNFGGVVRVGHRYSCADDIEEKLQAIQDRTYGSDGTGNFFPMVTTENDQRRIEIWLQANEYLIENYL